MSINKAHITHSSAVGPSTDGGCNFCSSVQEGFQGVEEKKSIVIPTSVASETCDMRPLALTVLFYAALHNSARISF